MILDIVEKREKDIVFVYTACSSIEEARNIGYLAVEEKLAISADYWIINSIYPWQKVIQETDQCMLLFSTERGVSDNLVDFIEKEHSYKIPMIIKTDKMITSSSYALWVDETLEDKSKYLTAEEDKLNKKHESPDYQFGRLK